MLQKICSACDIEKPLSLFSKDSSRSDGYQKRCKSCNKDYYSKNKEKVLAYRKQYREDNKDKIQGYYSKNKDDILDHNRSYRKVNKHIINALNAKRRVQKISATPEWANEDVIKGLYELAALFRRANLDLEVDHIVPLQGTTVCGLHCENNLQLLPSVVNNAKSNRIWPDMW